MSVLRDFIGSDSLASAAAEAGATDAPCNAPTDATLA
jgi:hypothetical protein